MNIDLAGMVRRRQPKRKSITLRPIQPTQVMAQDLYREAYTPIVAAINEASTRIQAEYERSLPSPVVRDSVADLQGELDRMGSELSRLVLRLVPSLSNWALRTERWHRGKWRGAVLTATGVDLETMLSFGDVSETVEVFVARNVALMNDLVAQARGRIADIVFRNYQTITPIREVAKEVQDATGMSKRRAMLIAQDQTSKLSAALDQARQEQAGGEKFKWMHSRKKHPRKEHVARDGNIYRWTDPVIVDDKPGYAPFCGCRAAFVLELD